MKIIKSLIRSLVASPKNLHYDKQLNLQLDLSYITPNLIVSSAPTTSYLESWYRYPLKDLILFLNLRHGIDNWFLFNFRGEDPGYSNEQVKDKVAHFPFPDHYPPILKIMMESTVAINDFLSLDQKNIAVLHCKAGKGRSGTICCAFLMYDSIINKGQDIDIDQVISYYTSKRMRFFGGDGVSILSQRRYLKYWHMYLTNEELELRYQNWVTERKTKKISKIILRDCMKKEVLLSLSEYEIVRQEVNRENTIVKILIPLLNSENCNITKSGNDMCYELRQPIEVDEDVMIGIGNFCYIWFNMFFENELRSKKSLQQNQEMVDHGNNDNFQFTFKWEEVDGVRGTKLQGFKLFSKIEILLRDIVI
ncbi:TEP1 [Candida jiufengensis]|uniref:TEP1 n=1 Tax=Candida jiufengensis TaxID=497108 RepID=UPI002224324F|nr:TEP1 [Candida jiufengensis]KAI5950346.1 TEP1 [Candida jiufengensis]